MHLYPSQESSGNSAAPPADSSGIPPEETTVASTCSEPDSPRSPLNGDDLETTFQLDEDTLPDLSRSDAAALKNKKRRQRRKRLSESLSQPKFADCYQFSEEYFLGCGSYGSVYGCSYKFNEVENCRISEPTSEFAVKIIDKKGHSRTRLFNEIEILHQCKSHPNIVQLIDFIEEESRYFLVFEKLNGGPLLQHIEEQRCFSEDGARAVVKDLATALSFLHQKGIAHRDLKPANILCTNRHSPTPIKICDFDLASAPCTRMASGGGRNAEPTSPDLLSPVGSAEYMAPEVVRLFTRNETTAYDKRCDMWSLGVIMYIMLCGYAPFTGRCGFDCGWDAGQNCEECQGLLMDAIQAGHYSFDEEDWDEVSQEAMDLIRHLLETNPDKRLTAQGVLEHPWIRSGSRSGHLSDPIPLSFVASKLRKTSQLGSTSERNDRLVSNYRAYNQTCVLEQEPNSPIERRRLGTEDSGFGGETVASVFPDSLEQKNSHFGDQFDFSEDESLFSSGCGVDMIKLSASDDGEANRTLIKEEKGKENTLAAIPQAVLVDSTTNRNSEPKCEGTGRRFDLPPASE